MTNNVYPQSLLVEVKDTQQSIKLRLKGRAAWALVELKQAGPKGCTPIDHPGPRWAAYVHKLRQCGLRIETMTEPHGGPYAGNHARYVLRSFIQFLKEE